jgi:hypothetical protein
MPQIAEMREIDGELWVKVERATFKSHDAMQILSSQEIQQLRLATYREVGEAVALAASKIAKEIYS